MCTTIRRDRTMVWMRRFSGSTTLPASCLLYRSCGAAFGGELRYQGSARPGRCARRYGEIERWYGCGVFLVRQRYPQAVSYTDLAALISAVNCCIKEVLGQVDVHDDAARSNDGMDAAFFWFDNATRK